MSHFILTWYIGAASWQIQHNKYDNSKCYKFMKSKGTEIVCPNLVPNCTIFDERISYDRPKCK